MTRSFAALAEEVARTWPEDARQVYEAARIAFQREMEARAELGAELASARKQNGLTQAELAARSGIDQAEVSRIERGVGNPTATTLIRLSSALGRTVTLRLAPIAS